MRRRVRRMRNKNDDLQQSIGRKRIYETCNWMDRDRNNQRIGVSVPTFCCTRRKKHGNAEYPKHSSPRNTFP